MGGRQVVIEFLGKDKSLGSTTGDVDRKTSKLGDTLKKVGKVAALGLAAGALIAGKALFDMTKAAIEDEASQAALAKTLRDNAGATDKQIAGVEKWISAQGRSLGVTDDELRPALQRLTEATGDVGEAQKLASLAMDVSAGTGKSLKSVSEALMKAQNGQIAGLSKLGIETKNAKGETLTFEQATRKMADTFGGQAATKANTLQGKMGRLKLIFDETKESIGAKLIPVVTKMADWFLSKGMPAIQKFGRELGEKVGPVLIQFGSWVKTKLVPAVQDLIGEIAPLVRKYMPDLKAAFVDAKPFLSLVGKLITDVLIPGIGKLAKVAIPWMVKQFGLVMKILGAVGKAGQWMWNSALQPVFKFIVTAIGKVLTWFGKMLQIMGKVPGMGWIGTLGDKLVGAGKKAGSLSDSIHKIPDSHDTRITADTSSARASIENLRSYIAQFTQQRFTATVHLAQDRPGHNARGTRSWRGGMSWVGEEGPELVNLPRGARVFSNPESRAMAGGGGGGEPIIVQLVLDGKVIHESLVRRRRRLGTGLALG